MAGTAVTYNGPHVRVWVDVPDGPRRVEAVEVQRGETKTFPADLAARLLTQGDWSTPAPKRAPAKAAKTLTPKTESAPAAAETREEK